MELPKKVVGVCQNHLALLYEAIKSDDFHEVVTIEHSLTKEEECVACAYLFEAKGSIRNALAIYLQKEGFAVDIEKKISKKRFRKILVTSNIHSASYCIVFIDTHCLFANLSFETIFFTFVSSITFSHDYSYQYCNFSFY